MEGVLNTGVGVKPGLWIGPWTRLWTGIWTNANDGTTSTEF